MFITKRQQEALLALSKDCLYLSEGRPGCWFNLPARGFFSATTVRILFDAGWVGRGTRAGVSDYTEVVSLTPEGRKLARLLSARSK